MAHKVIDRCKETTSTTGTGSLTLTGAVTGFVTMADATAGLTTNGDTSWFCAENGAEWEVFLGTRTSSTVLARTTVLSSSNAGAAVSFTAAPVVFSTVPAAALIAAAAPAFRAYLAADQSGLTSTVPTKLNCNTEEFDTNNCYDNATNYRFTPNVPGYYMLTFMIDALGATMTSGAYAEFRKNGSGIGFGSYGLTSTGLEQILVCSRLVYMNGTTDYAEVFATLIGTSLKMQGGSNRSSFSGHFVRPG